MKFNRKSFKRLLAFLAVLAPLAFVLRTYVYWKEIEVSTGFFTKNAIACTVYNGLGFFVFGICLLLAWSKKGVDVSQDPRPASLSFSEEDSLLMQDEPEVEIEQDFPEFFLHGFAKKIARWNGTFSAFATILPGFGFVAHSLSLFLHSKENISPYTMLLALFSLFSGAYFLIFAFRNSIEKSAPYAFFALVPAFWCAIRMIVEYRDIARFVNKSLYIGQFLFIISLLVFFLYQAQSILGEENFISPNFYAFSGIAACFFGLTARLPQLLAVMGEKISMDLVDSSTLLMDLAITLFIITKLRLLNKRG